jgi:hypothetical protein
MQRERHGAHILQGVAVDLRAFGIHQTKRAAFQILLAKLR